TATARTSARRWPRGRFRGATWMMMMCSSTGAEVEGAGDWVLDVGTATLADASGVLANRSRVVVRQLCQSSVSRVALIERPLSKGGTYDLDRKKEDRVRSVVPSQRPSTGFHST